MPVIVIPFIFSTNRSSSRRLSTRVATRSRWRWWSSPGTALTKTALLPIADADEEHLPSDVLQSTFFNGGRRQWSRQWSSSSDHFQFLRLPLLSSQEPSNMQF
ncbi:hypothetical protein LXL04_018082 [Taraxacum kok-saghyz]